MIIPVILAGGSGTRLWPLSRELYPKQLLALTDEYTMLQHTLLRLRGMDDIADPIVICNARHRFVTSAQLSEIDVRPSTMILEPVGKNTAPAVTVAAMMAVKTDPSAIIMVLPADHLINDVDVLHRALDIGARLAARDHLVTFGVVPDAPETGFGYIRKGPVFETHEMIAGTGPEAFVIKEFVEKPDRKTAIGYLASGEYCWNSGMFMFRAATVLSELGRFAKDIVSKCEAACANGSIDGNSFMLDAEAFGSCRADSIDYAVMEKTEHGVMVPFDAGWNDLGSWEALWAVGVKDENGNVVRGDVIEQDTKNTLVFAESRLVSVVGLENIVVVEAGDSVLVVDREHAQNVRAVAEGLKADGRIEAISHGSDYYSWGRVDIVAEMEDLSVRRITVFPGERVGLKVPAGRTLNWNVMAGTLVFDDSASEVPAKKGDTIRIDPETVVTAISTGEESLVIVEVFTAGSGPDHFC
ncbi:MAG: mannose-1-phosphate guanylyltransferase/mannose-6-phosphate isomerase [Deltaproteobacteria bacterium]|nr:mannose-1-phosphate guanylyltransferase/mannose-6-phosphate isomerase [Deltaproteobacteria bacterium]